MATSRAQNVFRPQARQHMMHVVAGCALLAIFFATGCPIPEPTTRPVGKATTSKNNRSGRKPDQRAGPARRPSTGAGDSSRRSGGGPAGVHPDVSALPGRVHCVQAGETLFSITKTYYGDGKYWRKVLVANRHRITDPSQLRVGMKLIIP